MKKILSIFFSVLITVNFVSAAGITNPRLFGTDCTPTKPADFSGAKEINIDYAGRDDITYANTSPRKIQLIVWHDPGSNKCEPEWAVNYGQTIAPPGHPGCSGVRCGYTFYVGTDGRIIQAAPMNVRTNHATTYNPISYGITLMCAGGKSTLPASQSQNAVTLSQALRVAYGFNQMIPHGSMPQRMNSEGYLITGIARSAPTTDTKFLIHYKLGGGAQLYCKVEGAIPPCTTNCENTPVPGQSFSNARNPTDFSSPYTDGKGNYTGDARDWGYPYMNPRPPVQSNPYLNNLLNPNQSNPYLYPPVTSPTTTASTTQAQGNAKCSAIYIQTNKDNFNKIYADYNSSYRADYGPWPNMKDASILTFDIRKILAKVYAQNLAKIYENLQKCL